MSKTSNRLSTELVILPSWEGHLLEGQDQVSFISILKPHGRKVMTNLDSILKSRDITLPTKVCLVKAMVFPVVIHGYESWNIKKTERRRIDAFGFCFFNLINFNLFILLYNIVLVLPYIDLNLPRVYMCSPSWTPPPTSLPIPSLWVIPVHHPQAPCTMHWTCTGNSFQWQCFNAILPSHPTLALSHRVQKTVLYICVSFAVSHTGLSLWFF